MTVKADQLADVAARLVTHGEAIGARVRIGICDYYQSCGYLFAVINHRGETLALAHDAFEAARWFMRAETQLEWEEWVDDATPTVELPSDVEVEAKRFVRRRCGVVRRARAFGGTPSPALLSVGSP